MNIDNIKIIMSSKLWEKMTRHKGYIDYKILKTDKDSENKYFHCLLVFFDNNAALSKLKEYMKEGRVMIRNEGLDFYDEPLYFYGTIRAIVFS